MNYDIDNIDQQYYLALMDRNVRKLRNQLRDPLTIPFCFDGSQC